jgi:3-phenylpropionate/trans-cinnamate dioxygenase ferredoxin subunit
MGLLSKKKKGEWVEVAHTKDFRISKQVTVGRNIYTLYKLKDGIFCTQGSCSHEYSPLVEGIVMEDKVFCEKHGSRFNIKSGQVIDYPATENIKTYPVKVENEVIFIQV